MVLLGGWEERATPGDHTLIADLYRKLPGIEPRGPRVTRLLGWHRGLGEQGRYFGVALRRLDTVPQGMTAWVLGRSWWEMRPGVRRRIHWSWRSGDVGEFVPEGESPFTLFARVPLDRGAPVFDDAVVLEDHDPSWVGAYAAMERHLRRRLGTVARRIEHYGSTAVPGLPAKPVIDILVQIPDFDTGRRAALRALDGPRWEYWWYEDHLVFVRRARLMGKRTHHVHLAPSGHRLWEGLRFRDRLRRDPVAAARYAELKRDLAALHAADRETYTREKTAFVRRMTEDSK